MRSIWIMEPLGFQRDFKILWRSTHSPLSRGSFVLLISDFQTNRQKSTFVVLDLKCGRTKLQALREFWVHVAPPRWSSTVLTLTKTVRKNAKKTRAIDKFSLDVWYRSWKPAIGKWSAMCNLETQLIHATQKQQWNAWLEYWNETCDFENDLNLCFPLADCNAQKAREVQCLWRAHSEDLVNQANAGDGVCPLPCRVCFGHAVQDLWHVHQQVLVHSGISCVLLPSRPSLWELCFGVSNASFKKF